jgi:hypothetical protein
MKYLPPAAVEVPSFMQILGFKQIPSGPEEVKKRYRQLAKQMHPDAGQCKLTPAPAQGASGSQGYVCGQG